MDTLVLVVEASTMQHTIRVAVVPEYKKLLVEGNNKIFV